MVVWRKVDSNDKWAEDECYSLSHIENIGWSNLQEDTKIVSKILGRHCGLWIAVIALW